MDFFNLARLFAVGLFFLFMIFMFFYRKEIKKCKNGLHLPLYYLFYSDQKSEHRSSGVIYSKLIISEKFDLYGKPDYVFKHRYKNIYIPVELKSGRVGGVKLPHEGDLLQLAAYFLIVADHFAGKVTEGRLVYSDAAFKVRNTRRLRKRLLGAVKDMRTMLRMSDMSIPRCAAANYAKCRHCICNGTVCKIKGE